MTAEPLDTHQKALETNLDGSTYGTFAEIGAGQEVARWFFRVGGAAGTIAKTISAYDMTVSDAIYGPCDRYVSRRRLAAMLDHEFELLRQRLEETRGAAARFFVFADTVTAKSYLRDGEWHGWMGIRVQLQPLAEPSDIIIHIRMLDRDNVQQQEALGILGVNFVYGALYLAERPEALIASLLDNLSTERVEVDMVKFSGPAFARVDNRLMSLQLVQLGLTHAAMFTSDGEAVHPAETLYKRPILVERGSFRPVTNATLDMLNCALAQFVQEPGVNSEEVVVLMEMTLRHLTEGDRIDHRDFLERVDILGALGKTVMVSNYGEFYRLAGHLFRYTKQKIGIVMGVPTLQEIFDTRYYTHLEGGILESFGRLFKNDLKLYVYPLLDVPTGSLITAGNLRVDSHLRHLYAYLTENHFIQPLRDINERYLPIVARDVLERIKSGDPGWEELVPPQVAAVIKERRLLGYTESHARAA